MSNTSQAQVQTGLPPDKPGEFRDKPMPHKNDAARRKMQRGKNEEDRWKRRREKPGQEAGNTMEPDETKDAHPK